MGTMRRYANMVAHLQNTSDPIDFWVLSTEPLELSAEMTLAEGQPDAAHMIEAVPTE